MNIAKNNKQLFYTSMINTLINHTSICKDQLDQLDQLDKKNINI